MRLFVLTLALLATLLVAAGCTDKSREVTVAFDDPRMGRVEVHGTLMEARNDQRLLVIVHGLGDNRDSLLVKETADAALAEGWSTLRVSMRGADAVGRGLYYAGDHEDLAAIIASPALVKFRKIAVLGFSLGGHNAIRYAATKLDPRVVAVVAVSAPLDLAKTTPILDASPQARAVLQNVARQYRGFHDDTVAKGKLQWLPNPERVARFTTMKAFDDEITAPILKYKDAADYYAKESAVAVLKDIAIPVAVVAGKEDPLVPLALVKEALVGAPERVRLFEVDGGHLTMSPSLTMRQRGPDGLVPQALAWIKAVGG